MNQIDIQHINNFLARPPNFNWSPRHIESVQQAVKRLIEANERLGDRLDKAEAKLKEGTKPAKGKAA